MCYIVEIKNRRECKKYNTSTRRENKKHSREFNQMLHTSVKWGVRWYLVLIWKLLNIQSDLCDWHYRPLINPRRNNREHHHIQDSHKKVLQHKRETYNTQGSVRNRTRSPTLCRGIEAGVLTTLPRRPSKKRKITIIRALEIISNN